MKNNNKIIGTVISLGILFSLMSGCSNDDKSSQDNMESVSKASSIISSSSSSKETSSLSEAEIKDYIPVTENNIVSSDYTDVCASYFYAIQTENEDLFRSIMLPVYYDYTEYMIGGFQNNTDSESLSALHYLSDTLKDKYGGDITFTNLEVTAAEDNDTIADQFMTSFETLDAISSADEYSKISDCKSVTFKITILKKSDSTTTVDTLSMYVAKYNDKYCIIG